MSFNVIKVSPIEMYDFPLVVYNNFCRITHRLHRQTDRRMDGHSFSGYTSACIACYANALVKMFGRQWTKEAKIAIFTDRQHSHLTLPLQRTNANICINLILQETIRSWATFLLLTVYGYSPANFRTVLPESWTREPISCRARNRF